MYCHNCGKKVIGNFCSNCGTKVIGGNPDPSNAKIDWTAEQELDRLIKYPEVRKEISKYANESKKRLSSQKFLELVDLTFAPLVGLSTKSLSEIIVPLYHKLGINTGKSAKRNFNQIIQEVIVKSLCSLAKNGYPLKSCELAANGIVLTAEIPSSMWTWGGNIVISIEEITPFSEITIVTKIKGQLYDWGKSKKVIKKILSDIDNIKLSV